MSTGKDVKTTKHSAFSSRPVVRKQWGMGPCSLHIRPATMKDALDLVWCDECKHRYDLVTWGKAHGYPAVHVHPYAIAEGEWFWRINALMARDECVHTLLNGLQGGSDDEEEAGA